MKAKCCSNRINVPKLLILCGIALYALNIGKGSAGAAPRILLEVTMVEYPAEKGADVFRLIGLANSPAGSFIDTPAMPRTGPAPQKSDQGITAGSSKSSITPTWILTKSMADFILEQLQQSPDAQVIAGPRTIASDRERTRVNVQVPGELVTQLGASAHKTPLSEELDVFPTLYLEPQVDADGYTIALTTKQTIRDLIGYDLGETRPTWDYAESSGANAAPTAPSSVPFTGKPKPILRLREATEKAVIWDGQTVVVSGLVATNNANVARQNRGVSTSNFSFTGSWKSQTPSQEEKKLLVFITPTLIGEDGKPLHSPKDMPFSKNGAPPQPKP
ncbi:MAG: Type secretion system protein [Verrucomicrobiales bacterium]|nr:Type secretion system protein [Verrucomicrobiales bacterium]